MGGRQIYLLVSIIFFLVVNIYDFDREYKGDNSFFKEPSGFACSIVVLPTILGLGLGLKGTTLIVSIILLYMIYVIIYILIYKKINNWRNH